MLATSALLAAPAVFLAAAEPLAQPAISVKPGADGRLVYAADANGNTVLDFSRAGYSGGGEAIPAVPAKIIVAIEKNIPAAARAKTRAAPLVRSHSDSTWAMAAPGSAYLVYTMAGEAVDLDLSGDKGSFALSWLDSSTGELRASAESVAAGQVAALTPPAAGTNRPWAAWLTRR